MQRCLNMITNQAVLNKIKAELKQAEKSLNEPEAFKSAMSRVQVLCELVTSEQGESKPETELTEAEKTVMFGQEHEQSQGKYHDEVVESIFDF